MTDDRMLSIYLNNHLTGANGGVDLFRRAASQHRGTDLGNALAALGADVETDRDTLKRLMGRLGISENKPMTLLGKVGERVGRLKPNGYIVRRSPLADVIELEALRDAVAAKKAGWEVLRAVAAKDERITLEEMEELIDRAEAQSDELYRLHLQVTERQLVGS